jgi:hypothetical protein
VRAVVAPHLSWAELTLRRIKAASILKMELVLR